MTRWILGIGTVLFLLTVSTYAQAQEVVLSASFNTWAQGFTYADDTFRGTAQPSYASGNYASTGGFAGGGLRVVVGGVNNVTVIGMSGGWSKAFSVSGNGVVNITLKYRLVFPATYESDECGQALVSLDGILVGPGPGDFLRQFCGTGVAQNSGWQTATFAVTITGGTHSLTVGGWNNQKTTATEKTEVFFDEIVVTYQQQGPTTLFSDNFADGNANGWVVVNDTNTASSWQVINGEYQQLNAVGNFINSYHTGSYSYYQNGLAFTDYEVAIKAVSLSDGANRDTIGLMFRYKNNNNYYRFSMSRSQGFRRLEKKVGGVFSTLAFDGRGFTFGQPVHIAVNVDGNKIFVYVNDEPVFSATDSSLSSGSVALFAQHTTKFDDVVIIEKDPNPTVVIAQPTAYSLETGNTLSVSATAANIPTGGGVRFIRDKGTASESAFTLFAAPFTGSFSPVTQGNHTIDALLVNSSGVPLSNLGARDQNVQVGAIGRSLVVFGDSITRGEGDNVSADDASADGRNIHLGYAPILNNLLSASLNRPITVMCEGLGGTTSKNGLNRLGPTITRHAKAQYWLILFGTNDSSGALPVPSGRDLLPGDSGYSGSYKDNLQQIITTLQNAGKVPLLAKVPIALGPCTTCAPYANPQTASRNLLIQEYNEVVDDLVTANDIPVVPPDLYTYFANHQNEFSDNLHPNGNGYNAVATLWRDALIQSGILN